MAEISIDEEDLKAQVKVRMQMIAMDLEEAFKTKLNKTHGVASGILKSGIRAKVEGDSIIIEMEEYWKYLEYGTPPHMPPVDAIEDWVKVKFGLSGKEGRSVAWAVAFHIKKYGTKPFPFVRVTLEKDYPEILKEWLGG